MMGAVFAGIGFDILVALAGFGNPISSERVSAGCFHIRNATAKVEYAGQTFLVDPFSAPKHSMNGFAGTFNNQAKMPLVGLPMSVNKILDGVDAVIVTHTHEGHWDETAARPIPKNLPV